MKERITYILADGEEGVNPATVQVNADSVKLPGFKAAKEWRITLSTTDLPDSVSIAIGYTLTIVLMLDSCKMS